MDSYKGLLAVLKRKKAKRKAKARTNGTSGDGMRKRARASSNNDSDNKDTQQTESSENIPEDPPADAKSFGVVPGYCRDYFTERYVEAGVVEEGKGGEQGHVPIRFEEASIESLDESHVAMTTWNPNTNNDTTHSGSRRALGDDSKTSTSGEPFDEPKARETLEDYRVNGKMIQQWRSARQMSEPSTRTPALKSNLQKGLFPYLNAYWDTWYAGATTERKKSVNQMVMLHVANHIIKARQIVVRNSKRLKEIDSKRQELTRELETAAGLSLSLDSGAQGRDKRKLKSKKKRKKTKESIARQVEEKVVGIVCKDQGFTRPRVLIMLPMKNSAFEIVNLLLRLLPEQQKKQVHKRKRFKDEFGPAPEDKPDLIRGADWNATFHGNSEDNFKFGVALHRGSVKLFTDFYNSDIIFASPLGLRTITGPLEAAGSKSSEYDFLSSIEVLVMMQADIFSMQNWEHVKVVLGFLNRKPFEIRDTDFSRVRDWNLAGQSGLFRQTIVVSRHMTLDIASMFGSRSKLPNISPRMRIRPKYGNGAISRVVPPVRQIFQRIECESLTDSYDKRFEYFTQDILPRITNRFGEEGRCLIVIPSYFDFVKIRNYLKKNRHSFANCCEYTQVREQSRARQLFYHGEVQYLLTTERFTFYKRLKLRGARHILFYAPPENPAFYHEAVNLLNPTSSGASAWGDNVCVTLFTKYDALRIVRLVGETRAQRLIGHVGRNIDKGNRGTFMFISDSK